MSLSIFNEMSRPQLLKVYKKAVDDYEKGNFLDYSDDQFDTLELILKQGETTKIPFYMSSLDKLRPHVPSEAKKLEKFRKTTSSFIVQEKLDGVSCLVCYNNLGVRTVYKKPGRDGNSRILYSKIRGIPKELKNINIRGELVINKFSKFEDYSTPRSYVAGTSSKKDIEDWGEIEFVAYEIVEKISMPPEKQIEALRVLGFKTVKTERSSDNLENLLRRFREESEFAIDGIVIKKDISCERETKGNPKHIFAFKMLTQHHKGIVSSIEWNLSKTGKLKPKLKFDPPVKVGEVKISYVNAYNAKFVKEKKLGPGACVNIYLSGDVIPCILSVEKGSENITFPDGIFDGRYYWKYN